MTNFNENVKYAYERILNGDTVYLNSNEIDQVNDYASSLDNEYFLNNCTCEDHDGENVYKCYLQ
ncbi:hypothetical protein [Metabacillus sp. Hm71]|uniref:hypothetical protein n=1 Tax=Metabacillus sp. Hm71 TaxID=3450743 RepID=UPI003F440DC1